MFKHCINMKNVEVVRSIRSWGNSAGVLLPREWAGKEAKIILIDRSLEIKKEVFDILSLYLEDILGIYLTGSYARNEQTEESDIDIIAISNKTKKEIISGKYHVSIATLSGVKKTLEARPELILPRLDEAKVILNSSLLEELKSKKIDKNSFKEFIEESRRIIKINKGFIELDKKQGFKELDSINLIYSIVLRLRGIFLINKILRKEKYKKKDFLKWIEKEIGKEAEKVYCVYSKIRDREKIKANIKIEIAEKLLKKLEKEVDKLER